MGGRGQTGVEGAERGRWIAVDHREGSSESRTVRAKIDSVGTGRKE